MIRKVVLGLLSVAATFVHGEEPDPEPTRLDTLLAGVPVWLPERERIVVVDARVSCCAEMLPRLLVLDARTGRIVRRWGDIGTANDDSLEARHEAALRREVASVVGSTRMVPLALDSVMEHPAWQPGPTLDWTLSPGGRPLRVGPVASAAIAMPSACCHGVESTGDEPCSAFPNRWHLHSLPGTRRVLAGCSLVMELDGCERGPDYRILRGSPASSGGEAGDRRSPEPPPVKARKR